METLPECPDFGIAFLRLPVAAALLDSEFRFVAINDAFTSKFEYLPADLLGRPVETMYEPESAAVALRVQQLAAEADDPHLRLERRVRSRTGRSFDALVCVASLTPAAPRHYGVAFQHVAPAHQRERWLLSRAEMFRIMVEQSPLPISVQNADWKFVLVNQAYCDLMGYTESELLGMDPADLLHTADNTPGVPDQRSVIAHIRHEEIARHTIIREFVRRDGRRVRCHCALGFTRGPSDEPLWCGTLIDLSAIEEAQERLTEVTGISDQMRERFDTFTSIIHDGVAVLDQTRRFVLHANAAMRRLLGLDEQKLQGIESESLWKKLAVQDRGLVRKSLVRADLGESPEFTVRVVLSNQAAHWVRLRIVADGMRSRETFIIAEDVTSQIEKEAEQAAAIARQKQSIVSEIHHRIKNHVQGMIGLVTWGQESSEEAKTHERRTVERLSAIAEVHGILTRSPGAARLSDLVEAISEAAPRMGQYQVILELDDDAWALGLVIDEAELVPIGLVINELIMNAGKHGLQGHAIKVQHRRDGDAVLIVVSNAAANPDPIDVDLAARTSGIGLIRSLLPRRGASLTYHNDGSHVIVELRLQAPAIHEAGPEAPLNADKA